MTDEQRRDQRPTVEGMRCSLGYVLDLSNGGARLLTPRPLRGRQTLVLHTARMGELRLEAEVQWRSRLAFREHVVGLRFNALGTVERRALGNLVDQAARGVSPSTLHRRGRGVAAALFLLGLAAAGLGYLALRHPGTLDALPALAALHAQHGRLVPPAAFGGAGLLAVVGLTLWTRKPAPGPRRVTADRRHEPAPGRRAGEAPPPDTELLELRRGQHVLNTILESSLTGIVVLRAERGTSRTVTGLEVRLANPAAAQLVGRDVSQLVGRPLADTLPCLRDHTLYADLISVVESGLPLNKHYKIGNPAKWYQLAVVQLGDGLTVTFADTTDQHLAQDKLRHVAYHDELTKLPNRKLLMEHLDKAFHRSQRFADHHCALLFLDFDRFKFVNDTLGHDIGDLLLINIAKRLRENLRAADTAASAGQEQLSARLGGDEFVVLLDGVKDESQAVAVAERLLAAFNEPHLLDGHTVVSTASIGIALSRDAYGHVDELLRDADTAMYRAKQSGKARYVVFDQTMHDKLLEEAQMEKDLRAAVAEGAFSLVYEPIVDLAGGGVTGFEALIRWRHPTRGELSPAAFLPLAEELNLVLPLGEWVVRNALRELKRWRDAGHTDAVVHLNLARAQLYDERLTELLRRELAEHGLPPGHVVVEVTEKTVMHDAKAAGPALGRLKALGVGVALDDFGTGHSSLNLLQQLPLDVLKIDKTLIDNAGSVARHYGAIIATITELARNLDMQVVAEGIERAEQLTLLRTLRCDRVQGFLFSRPLAADGALEMLARGKRFAALAA